MTSTLPRLTIPVILALVLSTAVGSRGQSGGVEAQGTEVRRSGEPRLVVLLVVDQMRADYVERFRADWTGGLRRLVSNGAWFRTASYPYLTTVTCPGHATIVTGAFPHTHGVTQNTWWDREGRKPVTCTEDPRATGIAYNASGRGGDSAYRVEVPTLTDRLRSARAARVVSLSLKDRSAVMLAGHGAESVTWFDETLDGWITSSAFTDRPQDEVRSFIRANPMAADYGKIWTRSLAPARYLGADDQIAEAPPEGWSRTFPHALKGRSGRPDADFIGQWERSPFADEYLGRFAAALAKSFELGRHDGIDVLAVSFSTPDLVGHAFGPKSQEIQDTFARLDRTIGSLLDQLDALVGRNEYVVALTSDHGVQEIPEQALREGHDAGRISSARVRDALEQRLRSMLGSGKHVAQVIANDIYFEPQAVERLEQSPAMLDEAVSAVASTPGVQRVFRASEIKGAAHPADLLQRAAALGYFPGRSGDLVIVPKRGWMFSTAGTTHGTASPDDQRVPVIFYGRGIRPGEYAEPATPADIAPTLAALCGITLPAAEGHPLRHALK
jgi:predicted AlkP superfamily pyrophosphatase or phosphodiesterase